MTVTTLGGAADTMPVTLVAPLLDFRTNWSDEWINDPRCEFRSLDLMTGNGGTDRLVFEYSYGQVKYPGDVVVVESQPLDLDRQWVRVRAWDEVSDYQTVWVGMVAVTTESVHGASPVAGGVQTFTAYGPKYLMQKTKVTRAASGSNSIGWSPSFNRRNASGALVGNRSGTRTAYGSDLCYTFGSTLVWRGEHILEYLMRRFMDNPTAAVSPTDYPIWAISDPYLLLRDLEPTLPVGDAQPVAELVDTLINRAYGLDYVITPTAGDWGFTITIFSLIGTAVNFGTASLAANPNTVTVYAGLAHSISAVQRETSSEYRYARLELIGERQVLCFSLSTDIVIGWTSGLEGLYKAGTATPSDEPNEHDAARARDRYVSVYQRFQADNTLGAETIAGIQPVALDDNGDVDAAPLTLPDYQSSVQETLSWLPLYEGYDYSADPATRENTAIVTGQEELMRPQAWLTDPEASRYVECHAVGISVQGLTDAWGVQLNATPNHRLALNHAAGLITETDPEFDYDTLTTTIAIRGDERIVLAYTTGDTDGTVYSESAPGMEFWSLKANTIVGVHQDGTLLDSGASDRVLRNDNTRYHQQMAGLIARYAASRDRATITIEGFPYAAFSLIGTIVTEIRQDDDLYTGTGTGTGTGSGTEERALDAPVTGVQVTGGREARVRITAGFAL